MKWKLTRPVKVYHMGLKIADFVVFPLSYFNNNERKFSTDADVNGLSFAIYRNSILQLQLKIKAKI